MIFINLDDFEPDDTWMASSFKHYYYLEQEQDKSAYLSTYPIWTELIHDWREKYNKCWITESKNPGSHAQIEHFRPKGLVSIKQQVKDLKLKIAKRRNNQGYWWLAYDWRNYRLTFSIPNTSKSSFFPLKSGSPIARNINEDESQEINYLIDPTVEEDVKLITIDPSDGRVIPTTSEESLSDNDKWKFLRAKASIAIYDLDNELLVDGRKKIIKRCYTNLEMCLSNYKAYIDSIGSENQRSVFLKNVKHFIDELKDMMAKDASFSAAATSCIFSILEMEVYSDLRNYFN